ncbi:hypothetical protein FORC065_2021 [Yersinia enterocolitica]|nr:hypothetical protein FORC065_2021 [Yersinia enterocolitica]
MSLIQIRNKTRIEEGARSHYPLSVNRIFGQILHLNCKDK